MTKLSFPSEFCPDLEPFERIYKDVHANPELSRQEASTAALAAKHLESLQGFHVHRNIGGYGVVGVLHNGSGPTVLLRADMDALPHLETTKLPYASTKMVTDEHGKKTPPGRPGWAPLICLFQPAEEIAYGAQAMVDDGLYDKIPVPDIVLGQPVLAIREGVITLDGGPTLTAVDSFEIRIFGKSGHISRPDICIDPILTAANVVVKLQAIITKETKPEDFAIVACASINGGTTSNIVPDCADLRVSIRSYKPEIHQRLVSAVKRVVRAECEASGCLAVREPEFKTIMHMPPTINDHRHASILKTQFKEVFGNDEVIDKEPFGASEDFSVLATACGAPYVFYMWGYIEKDTWSRAEKEGTLAQIPQNHSAGFAPAVRPTLERGVHAFSVAALTFLGCSEVGNDAGTHTFYNKY